MKFRDLMIKKLFTQILAPPEKWKAAVIILSGILIGLCCYGFYLSRAYSYLSDDAETCVNCHIMAPQYATWMHSSHREYANCNDCHVPHNNVFNKYYFKAKDGLRHATIFTLRKEPQVIFIKEEGKTVVQDNCIRCHNELIANVIPHKANNIFSNERLQRPCWDCHLEVPHGRVNSLSSVPFARIPLPQSPVPEWIRKTLINESQ